MKVKTIILLFILSLPGIFYFTILYRSPDPFAVRRGDFLSWPRFRQMEGWEVIDECYEGISQQPKNEEALKPIISHSHFSQYFVASSGFSVLLKKENKQTNFGASLKPDEIIKLNLFLQDIDFEIVNGELGRSVYAKNKITGETARSHSYNTVPQGIRIRFWYDVPDNEPDPTKLQNLVHTIVDSSYFDEIFTFLFINYED